MRRRALAAMAALAIVTAVLSLAPTAVTGQDPNATLQATKAWTPPRTPDGQPDHDDRIIPLDGRPHLGRNIRQLAGDSRGHWEGDTLVVDTTTFTEKTNFREAPRNTRQDIFASDALSVVARFTLVDADTIRYQFTVEDPATWTRPWSGEIPIRRFEGPIFEYACHEGNYGLPNILRAARVLEKQEVAAEEPPNSSSQSR